MSVLKDGFWRDRDRKQSLEEEVSILRPRVQELEGEIFDLEAELARTRQERDGLRSELAFVAIELEGLMPAYVVENTSAFSDDYPFSTRVRPGLVRRIRASLAPKGATP